MILFVVHDFSSLGEILNISLINSGTISTKYNLTEAYSLEGENLVNYYLMIDFPDKNNEMNETEFCNDFRGLI